MRALLCRRLSRSLYEAAASSSSFSSSFSSSSSSCFRRLGFRTLSSLTSSSNHTPLSRTLLASSPWSATQLRGAKFLGSDVNWGLTNPHFWHDILLGQTWKLHQKKRTHIPGFKSTTHTAWKRRSNNTGTFHGQALRTLHGDPNLGIDLPATTSTRKIWRGKGRLVFWCFKGRLRSGVVGRRLGKSGWSLAKGWFLKWGMVEECSSGRIGGVERIPWKRFFQVCTLVSSKDAWVAQLWDQSGEVGHWNPVFTRLNNDWEMEEVEVFFRRLHRQALRRNNKDVMSKLLSLESLLGEDIGFRSTFEERMVFDKQMFVCYLCKREMESIDDNLLHFLKAREL
ncbi:hypothetical protein CK203_009796 [Vitis vinifera]|uniref:Uncharacterized protein n=1 Tax=Vitis vinifera TaxID=29760 RepID=A0A438JV41_VITVI|nr:hypothetical protein CK203_009796 [Vitis vinifera]